MTAFLQSKPERPCIGVTDRPSVNVEAQAASRRIQDLVPRAYSVIQRFPFPKIRLTLNPDGLPE
jgi:hypothetical protein